MPPAPARWRRGRSLPRLLRRALLVAAVFAAALTLLVHHRHGPKPPKHSSSRIHLSSEELPAESPPGTREPVEADAAVGRGGDVGTCATVERMGEEAAARGSTEQASLRVRELIRRHFELHGAARVRTLPAYEFCKQGFVLGKSSEAGFGNEMYKILTAAALSIMLNRSLIIGQTRGSYPFEEYISYTNHSFTVQEIKHLWRKHHCSKTYSRDLNMRVDNFDNPSETNVLCSNWNSWKDPIIWCWTADRLAKRGLPHPPKCPLCDQEDEDVQHLLITCVLSREFWFRILEPLGFSRTKRRVNMRYPLLSGGEKLSRECRRTQEKVSIPPSSWELGLYGSIATHVSSTVHDLV